MNEAAAPAVARGWLWTMRLAALGGLILHAVPLLMGLLPGIAVAAGYGPVLWLLRSEEKVDDLRRGSVWGRLVGAVLLLLCAIWIIGGRRAPSPGVLLYVCLPPAFLLISGWGLARRFPARPADWARDLPLAVLLAAAVYLVMPPPGHGPNYSSQARSRLHEIVVAEQMYAAANGGLHGSLECLALPRGCLADYPETAPTFLSQDTLEATHARHDFVFHPGPERSLTDQRGQTHSGFESFAVTAVPLDPDRPSLCADASGQILMRANGLPPPVEGGACVEGPGISRWN